MQHGAASCFVPWLSIEGNSRTRAGTPAWEPDLGESAERSAWCFIDCTYHGAMKALAHAHFKFDDSKSTQ